MHVYVSLLPCHPPFIVKLARSSHVPTYSFSIYSQEELMVSRNVAARDEQEELEMR